MTADKWKSEQRDWLLERLHGLRMKWLMEESSRETVFSPDLDVDRIAKGRTGGCARELDQLLKEIA